jgi:choline-sulfatase
MDRFVLLLCLVSAAGAAQSRPPAPAGTAPLPDVILVTIDTLRADHVGCYGARLAATPVLDGLCREGVRFEQAFTASPITNTSHATILTGLYPSRHGVTDFGVPLARSHTTLAQHLQKAGYQTAAFIGSVILDARTLAVGFDRGFDHYEGFPAAPPGKERWERVERRAEEVVRRAAAWLTANPRGPRFVWVHLYDPHDPYEAPPPFAARFQDSPYDGEIAYADQALGRLFAVLRRQGRYDRSLILVLSDHGEGLGEHGEDTHGILLYDSTLHVPLIVRLPGGARAGTVVTRQVSTADLLPTVLDVLGLGAVSADGSSFRDALDGRSSADHVVFAETDYPARFGWAPLKAVRRDRMKYIEAPRAELYDLIRDPREMQNLYEPWDQRVQALRADLAAFRALAPPAPVAATAPVDPRTIEELKALGYLGDNPGSTTAPEPSMLPDPKDKIEVQNQIHAGMMRDESGDTDGAMRAFARAVEADPQSFIALSQLGQLEFKAGRFKDATTHLAQAYALRNDPTVAAILGQALEKTGDLTAARSVLDAVLRENAGLYDARVALGRVQLALGDRPAAYDQWEAAILADGKRPEARIALARLLLSDGKKEEARRQLQRALAADPTNAEVKDLLRQAR